MRLKVASEVRRKVGMPPGPRDIYRAGRSTMTGARSLQTTCFFSAGMYHTGRNQSTCDSGAATPSLSRPPRARAQRQDQQGHCGLQLGVLTVLFTASCIQTLFRPTGLDPSRTFALLKRASETRTMPLWCHAGIRTTCRTNPITHVFGLPRQLESLISDIVTSIVM